MRIQTPIASPLCRTCIHMGSDVTRVITQTSKYQSAGCDSWGSLSKRLQGEGLYNATMKISNSSLHIACRKVRMTLTTTKSKNRASVTVEPPCNFADAVLRAETLAPGPV